jgi:hypothetical protein
VQGDGAEAPADQQAEGGEQHGAADAVDRPDRTADDPRPDRAADPLQRDGEEGADEDAGGDRDQRRVLRLAAVGEQRRADSRSERGAADEAGERQRAGDQAALVAQRGERDREENDSDVDEIQVLPRQRLTFPE